MRRARAGGSVCPCHATPAQDTTAEWLWIAPCGSLWKAAALRRCLRLQVLVRGAVVAFRERRALARLALARRRPAAGDAAVEQARLDLLLDEVDCGLHALLHRPRDLGLRGDGEVAADVLEQRPLGLREIEGIARQPLHRLLAGDEHAAAGFQLGLSVGVRIDHVLYGSVNGP